MLSDYVTFLQANIPWLAALLIATLLGAEMERQLGIRRKRSWVYRRNQSPAKRVPIAMLVEPSFDPAAQLRLVERSAFDARKLLNHGEARLFDILERACAEATSGWRVMAQVSLGEILSSRDADAYRAINSKRVDLLLVSSDGHPMPAVEFQGKGHHVGPAATRDAIKKEALRKAGIGYLEVMPGDTPADVRALILKLARRHQAIA